MKKREEDLTPAELSQRVVEILASAAARFAAEGKKKDSNPAISTAPTQQECSDVAEMRSHSIRAKAWQEWT